ncbi:N-acetylglutamate kinase [Hydrogenivirga caldilitoris]|uniref:Acetylglutamate kinase n=1 Tax=Hydrogenivirga caldilitoris TaxID=246264 RepID=A0A497XM66_9AQUI|nr:acetylglutamate kinase [Hydrogenivirga caldilitoris]RLJ69945.1 N-acetylglutamate kinase [Hydrogenivirga caldilitoris]
MEKLIEKAKILQEALPYIREFHSKVFVVKYGGSAMIREDLRESFAKDVVLLKYVGINVVIVHGGGPQISVTLERLGIKPKFIGGMRQTDEETMHVVEMVLSGDINKDIVALINRHSGKRIYAVGLSGRDGRLLKAIKLNKEVYFKELGLPVPEEDIGFVGEVVEVNGELINSLIEKNFIPVIAPVGVGDEGEAYNINADVAASEIARQLRAEKLIFLTDTEGVKDEKGELISSLTKDKAQELIERGVIREGMIPKVKSALRAMEAGVNKVHIIDGRVQHSILLEVFTEKGIGTEIVHSQT